MTDVYKCKICGGDLEHIGEDVAICQYCGTKQMLPKMTSERKVNLYDRANHYRSINEFDKASAVYEQVLAEDDSDAEVYWDLVLCRYGVEYVEDPRSKKRIPTVNRTQFQAIFDDQNYKLAIKYASAEQKEVIEADAELIDRIQKGILDISNKEQPYDIFICYKETDDSGRRTPDSVLAQDMYKALTEEGYKVFFSRITMEDKLGSAYEPYIFAALNSAKVMIAVGTKPEYFNAVWVKNEWSRFLGLINSGEKKTMIPAYKDMDPYSLPEEFSHLQAQDMGKLGFMQDLVRGIGKIISPTQKIDGQFVVGAYKERIKVFLESDNFASAKEYCDKVLDKRPRDSDTYILRLCAEAQVHGLSELSSASNTFDKSDSYINAVKFCTEKDKQTLIKAAESVNNRIRAKRKKKIVLAISGAIVLAAVIGLFLLVKGIVRTNAIAKTISAAEQYADEREFDAAYNQLANLENAQGSNSQLYTYIVAGKDYNEGRYDDAISALTSLDGYKESDLLLLDCRYKKLISEIDQISAEEALVQLNKLIEQGLVDSENLTDIIYTKKYTSEFESFFEKKDYTSCKSVLSEWKKDFPDEEAKFANEQQELWYQTLKNIEKSITDDSQVDDIFKLASICESTYKDIDVYLKLASRNQNHIDYAFERIESYPIAHSYLWSFTWHWLEGTWKSSDGYYFTLLRNGQTNYNLPRFDAESTYYAFNLDGIYYLYDINDQTQPPKTRKDMYKFTILAKEQLEVYCYKDKSKHILYKQ